MEWLQLQRLLGGFSLGKRPKWCDVRARCVAVNTLAYLAAVIWPIKEKREDSRERYPISKQGQAGVCILGSDCIPLI